LQAAGEYDEVVRLHRDNRFEGCPKVVEETQKGMWEKALGEVAK